MADTSTYRYPQDVSKPPFDKWVRFDAMRGRHILKRGKVVEQNVPSEPLASVILYLSESTLKTAMGVRWETAELGALVGTTLDVLGPSAGSLGASLAHATTPEGAAEAVKSTLDSMLDKVTAQNAKMAIKTTLVAAGNDLLADITPASKSAMEAALGIKVNPRTEVLFDTVAYREFALEFALVPRNKTEAENINNILEFFQFYMLPKFNRGTTDFLIGYPFEFEVGIWQGTEANSNKIRSIGQIGRCVVTGITIDHAAGGKVSFIQGDGGSADIYPAATTLSLNLQEVRLLDRTDFGRSSVDDDTLQRNGLNWPER
jgi:hypothetical protein